MRHLTSLLDLRPASAPVRDATDRWTRRTIVGMMLLTVLFALLAARFAWAALRPGRG